MPGPEGLLHPSLPRAAPLPSCPQRPCLPWRCAPVLTAPAPHTRLFPIGRVRAARMLAGELPPLQRRALGPARRGGMARLCRERLGWVPRSCLLRGGRADVGASLCSAQCSRCPCEAVQR